MHRVPPEPRPCRRRQRQRQLADRPTETGLEHRAAPPQAYSNICALARSSAAQASRLFDTLRRPPSDLFRTSPARSTQLRSHRAEPESRTRLSELYVGSRSLPLPSHPPLFAQSLRLALPVHTVGPVVGRVVARLELPCCARSKDLPPYLPKGPRRELRQACARQVLFDLQGLRGHIRLFACSVWGLCAEARPWLSTRSQHPDLLSVPKFFEAPVPHTINPRTRLHRDRLPPCRTTSRTRLLSWGPRCAA